MIVQKCLTSARAGKKENLHQEKNSKSLVALRMATVAVKKRSSNVDSETTFSFGLKGSREKVRRLVEKTVRGNEGELVI